MPILIVLLNKASGPHEDYEVAVRLQEGTVPDVEKNDTIEVS